MKTEKDWSVLKGDEKNYFILLTFSWFAMAIMVGIGLKAITNTNKFLKNYITQYPFEVHEYLNRSDGDIILTKILNESAITSSSFLWIFVRKEYSLLGKNIKFKCQPGKKFTVSYI